MISTIDQTGRKVRLRQLPSRIVSLVPSQTELLFDLGLEKQIVGVTKFCVHPELKRTGITTIGGTKRIKTARILDLRPDLVIANKEENDQATIFELEKKVPVWVSDVPDLSSAFQMISEVGRITGKEAQSKKMVDEIVDLKSFVRVKSVRLKAVYIIWDSPLMTVGGDTFINAMMEVCGLENVFSESSRYPEISIADLKEREVELVLLSSEPFPFKEKHLLDFSQRLPTAKCLLADGEMFSWYGSRMLKAMKYFSENPFNLP